MKRAIYLIISAGSVALIQWLTWRSGYNASLAQFGFVTPLVYIGTALVPLIVVVVAVVHLIKNRSPIYGRLGYLLCALAILVLPYLSWFPRITSMDGFHARMATIGPEEWRNFAAEARFLAEQKMGEYEDEIDFLMKEAGENREIFDALAPKYSFLLLGDWPPRIEFTEDRTVVTWGSGLVGTLSVDIWDTDTDASHYIRRERSPIELYPGIYLLD